VAGDAPATLGMLTGLAPGSRVAGYLLETLVGVGGMAAVFRARDERLGRVVALKLLAGDEAAKKRFVREARAVAAVDRPHIIPVYEAGEAAGVMFIAMRFVAGDDLQVIVSREGGLRPKRAASFISAVASALDASHAAGLLHRDVKPANMLVDTGRGRPEHVYLSDFGLARGIMSADGLTKGPFFGTPDYLAPEQINGLPAGTRADQYALACVAYTLLSGSAPFKREDPMAVLYAHLYKAPPRLTAVRTDLPRAVDQVLARGLAKALAGDRPDRPAHRPGSVAAARGADRRPGPRLVGRRLGLAERHPGQRQGRPARPAGAAARRRPHPPRRLDHDHHHPLLTRPPTQTGHRPLNCLASGAPAVRCSARRHSKRA